MSDTQLRNEALAYIANSRFGLLTYVRRDGAPITRAIGSFAPDGENIVFSTQSKSGKVSAISSNERVSFFFEQDGQELAQWKNVLVIGNAVPAESDAENARQAAILGLRNPRFKEKIEKDGLNGTSIFTLKTEEIQYLDRSKGAGGTATIRV
jgi:nitroimidazol reductase NimA-like FMN-containing flavoprotein (pyridoxamine 5'-phosphate oxidase superfamily)